MVKIFTQIMTIYDIAAARFNVKEKYNYEWIWLNVLIFILILQSEEVQSSRNTESFI